MKKKRLVIIGAGFGGIKLVRELFSKKLEEYFEIIIINRDNYFLFSPMLHEVATGGLDDELVIDSIREITDRCKAEFLQDTVLSVNFEERILQLTNSKITYDVLVLATGSKTNFYGLKSQHKNVIQLKSVEDARLIRNSIIETFEKNERPHKIVNFLVVGGGATGVELAAELSEYVNNDLVPLYSVNGSKIKIVLVSGSQSLIPDYDKGLQNKARDYLKKLGVGLITGEHVTKISKNVAVLEKGKELPFDLAFWVAGVKPNLPSFSQQLMCDDSGQLLVNDFLQTSYNNVYAIGDIVHGSPMLAQVAEDHAQFLAKKLSNDLKNIPTKPFKLKLKGKLLSLGQKNALGTLFGINISGRAVWFLWRTIYLSKIPTTKKKIKIAVNWTVNLFYPRNVTKI